MLRTTIHLKFHLRRNHKKLAITLEEWTPQSTKATSQHGKQWPSTRALLPVFSRVGQLPQTPSVRIRRYLKRRAPSRPDISYRLIAGFEGCEQANTICMC